MRKMARRGMSWAMLRRDASIMRWLVSVVTSQRIWRLMVEKSDMARVEKMLGCSRKGSGG